MQSSQLRAWQLVSSQQMVAEKNTLGDYKEFTKSECYHGFTGIIKYILSEEMKKAASLT